MGYDMGFNLMDRRSTLLDFCFADDIFTFVQLRVEAGNLLDPLVEQLDRISLLLNAYQRVVTTDEAQSPLQPRGWKLQDVDLQFTQSSSAGI